MSNNANNCVKFHFVNLKTKKKTQHKWFIQNHKLSRSLKSNLKTTGTDKFNYNVVHLFLLKGNYMYHSYLDLDIIALLRVEAGDHILVSLTIHLGRGINFSKKFIIQIDSTR